MTSEHRFKQMTEKEIQTDGKQHKQCKQVNESLQTDHNLYINFISNLFYNELKESLSEEISQHKARQLKQLLERSRHIIERIKFKSETGFLKYMPF